MCIDDHARNNSTVTRTDSCGRIRSVSGATSFTCLNSTRWLILPLSCSRAVDRPCFKHTIIAALWSQCGRAFGTAQHPFGSLYCSTHLFIPSCTCTTLLPPSACTLLESAIWLQFKSPNSWSACRSLSATCLFQTAWILPVSDSPSLSTLDISFPSPICSLILPARPMASASRLLLLKPPRRLNN